MKKIILIVVVLGILSVAQQVSAQVLIEQGKVRISAGPGETIADSITIHNTSDKETLRLKAYWEDFEYISPFDGNKNFIPRGTSKYSCSKWISFSPQEFTLAPLGKMNINYSLKMPKDASGGYYGVMFFESRPGESEGDIGVRIITRVGSLFFINTKNSDKSVSLEEFSGSDNAIQGRFVNAGNIFMVPRGIYYILDDSGRAVERGELDKFYLPPNESIPVFVPVSSELPPGEYLVVLTFDLEDGDNVVREIDVLKDGNNIKVLKTRK